MTEYTYLMLDCEKRWIPAFGYASLAGAGMTISIANSEMDSNLR